MTKGLDRNAFADCHDFIGTTEANSTLWQRFPRPFPDHDEELGEIYFEAPEQGIEIHCCSTPSGFKFSAFFLQFQLDPQRAVKASPYRGPLGIGRGDTTAGLISRLGPPDSTRDGFEDGMLGWQHPWQKWYHGTSVQILVEVKDGIVWRVIVGQAYY